MKRFIQAMFVFAMLAVCLFMLPKEAKAEEITSGTCGENLTWTLDDTGTLTISGEGEMYDYPSMPWDSAKETIQNVIIEDGVTSIGDCAFYGCSSLTTIDIPDTVTSIGWGAFYGCSGLTTIEIPYGVTNIGNQAFYGCSSLTTIDIPDTVTSIDAYAFWDCSSLTTITIPDGVTYIGNSTFHGCSGLTTIKIPDGVTYIGDQAFLGCSDLNDITLPDGLTYLGDGAFFDCSGLTTIKIPDGVTSIGDCAFYGCSGLTTIKIPVGVTYIGNQAFYGCSDLNDITLPDGLTYLGDLAFSGCINLSGDIIIPDGVQSIGNRTFEGCVGLLSVTIGKDVSSIGDSAFVGCSNLMTINIPDDVTYIGDWAFRECSALKDITLPDDLTYLGHGAFLWCSNLSGDIIIPDGVQSVGNRTFEGCVGLLSVTIGTNVGSIGTYAFAGCDSLTTFIIPEGITTIADETFAQCYSLTTIVIPKSVTEIGVRAFDNCYNLESVQYSGTWNEWKLIVIGESNECLTRVYCLESKEHTWVDGEITHAPTCVEEGTRRRVCDICGIQKTVTIPKSTEHNYNWVQVDENFHRQCCTVCGREEDAVDHSWDEGWISIYPTCKDEGEKTYTCTICWFYKTEPIEKLTKHSYDGWIKVDDVSHKQVCYVCGHEETAIHIEDEGWISIYPTCKDEGEKTYACTICYGIIRTELVGKTTEHYYNGWECVDDDCHKQVCYVCGDEDIVPHTRDNTWISKYPSCNEEGEESSICYACGHIKTEPIEKLTKHSYDGWIKVDDVSHKQVCNVCGYEDLMRHNWGEGWISAEPTCKSEGEMTYQCTDCWDYKTEEYGEKLTKHSYGSWVLDDNDNDKHKRTCLSCGDVETEYHNWGGGISIHPTCTTEGEMSYSCSICWDKTITEPIPKLEHSWGYRGVSVEATCKDEGLKTYACRNCNITKTESIPKLTNHSYSWVYADEDSHRECCTVCGSEGDAVEHNWYKWASKSPTCKEDGEITYRCDTCSEIKTEPIPKHTRHKYSSWEKADDNTHKRTCSVCGDVETADHDWRNWISVQPSCKDEGERTYRCSVCNDEKTEPIEKLTEHFWGDSWFSVEPTCIDAGEMTYRCAICSITKTEKVEKREDWHSYGDWESVDEETHKHSCSLCGVEETKPHKWHEVFSLEPTCNDTGIKIYQCICNDSKTEELDATGAHDYVDGVCTFCGNNDPDYAPPTQPSEPPVEPSEPSTQPSEPPVEPSEPTTEPQLDELGTKLAELEAIIVNLPDIPEKGAILLSLASIRNSIEIPTTEENLNAVLAMFDELSASVAAFYPEGEAEIVLEKIAEIEALISELLPEDNFEENLSLIEQIIQLIMNWLSELLALFGL